MKTFREHSGNISRNIQETFSLKCAASHLAAQGRRRHPPGAPAAARNI
jgi:hypothetical protein